MFTYKKYYEIDAPEASAGPATESLAAIMAKSGALNTRNEGEIPKINTTEKKVEPTAASAQTPAPANVEQPAAKAAESPKPTEVAKPAAPHTEAPVSAPSWQEVLKQQQPDTIFKELGYGDSLVDLLKEYKELDPKLVGLIRHWQTNDGNIKPYADALTTDFQKMSPEDVMRHQLHVQNLELDAKQLDTLFKLKVTNRYKLDAVNFSEEEAEEGRIELMADVKPIRAQLAAEQQNYILPKPAAKAAEPDLREQQRQQEALAYKAEIDNDPYTKNLLTSSKLTIGEGEEKFEFPVDTKALTEVLYNPDEWAKNLLTPDKKPDVMKQWLIAGVAKYGLDFFRQYAQRFKSLGGEAAIAPIENAKPANAGTPAKAETTPTNPAAAAAKHGRLVQGGSR